MEVIPQAIARPSIENLRSTLERPNAVRNILTATIGTASVNITNYTTVFTAIPDTAAMHIPFFKYSNKSVYLQLLNQEKPLREILEKSVDLNKLRNLISTGAVQDNDFDRDFPIASDHPSVSFPANLKASFGGFFTAPIDGTNHAVALHGFLKEPITIAIRRGFNSRTETLPVGFEMIIPLTSGKIQFTKGRPDRWTRSPAGYTQIIHPAEEEEEGEGEDEGTGDPGTGGPAPAPGTGGLGDPATGTGTGTGGPAPGPAPAPGAPGPAPAPGAPGPAPAPAPGLGGPPGDPAPAPAPGGPAEIIRRVGELKAAAAAAKGKAKKAAASEKLKTDATALADDATALARSTSNKDVSAALIRLAASLRPLPTGPINFERIDAEVALLDAAMSTPAPGKITVVANENLSRMNPDKDLEGTYKIKTRKNNV